MATFTISVEMHINAEDARSAMMAFERELEEHGAMAGDILIEVLPEDDDDEDDDDEDETVELIADHTKPKEEQAQQLGMGLGVGAYNDAMGCEVTSEDPDNMPT